MIRVVLDRMTMSSGLKSLRNKEESSGGTPTMRGSGILVGRDKVQSWSFGERGQENDPEAVKYKA